MAHQVAATSRLVLGRMSQEALPLPQRRTS